MILTLCSKRQGILALAKEDAYLMAMKNWEFAAKTDGRIKTLEAFRTFLSGQVLEWTPSETERLNGIIASICSRFTEKLSIGLSDGRFGIIKTSGLDEWKSAYTRENNIVLPVNKLETYDDEALEKLIIHEVFHLLSRYNEATRSALYEVLGFSRISLDESMCDVLKTRLVNPDALDMKWAMPLENGDWCMPIIFLEDGRLEFEAGDIFDRIAFKLLILDKPLQSGRVVEREDVAEFEKAFGKFGFGAHHPEELLAELFVDYVTDRSSEAREESWSTPCFEIFEKLRI